MEDRSVYTGSAPQRENKGELLASRTFTLAEAMPFKSSLVINVGMTGTFRKVPEVAET